MDRLWKYEDYVTFLSHGNSLVREWAFDALEKQYPNRYTDEVSRLISDEDSHFCLDISPFWFNCFQSFSAAKGT